MPEENISTVVEGKIPTPETTSEPVAKVKLPAQSTATLRHYSGVDITIKGQAEPLRQAVEALRNSGYCG